MNRYIKILLLILLLATTAMPASAFPVTAYSSTSRLSSGRWVKISIETDGLYLLPMSTLRSWGFSDPAKVHVYGYGGHRHIDELRLDDYRDDLPQVHSVLTDRGIVFYGLGAGQWGTSQVSHVYYKYNDYSTHGYYFLSEAPEGEERLTPQPTGIAGATNPLTSFRERCHYELERTASPGEAGPELLGEDMRYTPARTVTFNAPDAVADSETSFLCSFVSSMTSGGGNLAFTLNGSAVVASNNDRVTATAQSDYVHGSENLTRHTVEKASPNKNGNFEVGIRFTFNGTCSGAWLNFVTLLYERKLRLPSDGPLEFFSEGTEFALAGTDANTFVWEVTDPHNVGVCTLADAAAGTAKWSFDTAIERRQVAWKSTMSLPVPKRVGNVANQNLHADSDFDMVIITPDEYRDSAERLAELHRTAKEALTVKVVTPELVYNEFSSGTPDPGAFRRYFKMLYDRGNAGQGRPIRYALMFARTTLDNRGLSSSAVNFPTIPMWMTLGARPSLSDNDGYCTDDVTAMLEDGSGTSLAASKLCIAIGRMPVISATEASQVVDKIYQYAAGSRKTAWKHRFMFLADDQDNGIHLRQTEDLISQFENAANSHHLVRKVYMDAYEYVGTNYPEARSTMFRYLDEGVVWWSFVGHANTTGWTAEQQMTYTDLNSMYLRHWPFIYAATCNFLRLDGNFVSGGEILYKERYGGAIGIISATRPVYITENGYFSNAIGRAMGRRDADGKMLTPGEMYRQAKNNILTPSGMQSSSTNHLRYVFVGDPALPLAMPSNIVRPDSIGGISVGSDTDIVMPALGKVSIRGSVCDPQGKVLENFNGIVLVDIFDAERSRVTLGHGENGTEEPFQDYGERVYCGSTTVKNGIFTLEVSMPGELTQNFTPATMSLYAYSDVDDTEATGLFRDFYVYGYDNTAVDEKAPTIEQMVLNHITFRNGDVVNASPMLIATISDDTGINVSTAGIGHQMTATLDGTKTFTDISYYYTPASDGSVSGVINYPFEGLQPGNHTLALRVWDTAGNSTTASLDFFVQENKAPDIFEVYTDANPATTQANFYLSHNQPDNMMTVEVTVYNLLGAEVWRGKTTGRSDMFTTVPVTWDLTDKAGRRVGRGLYLYRASITADGVAYETASRRIAVAAQ